MKLKNLCALIAILLFLTGCTAHKPIPKWGYKVGVKPAQWGHYYQACKAGGWQSPINIPREVWRDDAATQLRVNFPDHADRMFNDGHSFRMVYDTQANTLRIAKHQYFLEQVIFHTPSETHVVGQKFPMEIQFIYQDFRSVQQVIVSVMVTYGASNYDLARIIHKLPSMNRSYPLAHINISGRSLLPERLDYYTYMGSLSMPPCTPGVHWYVMKHPITATRFEINRFREHFYGNTRPLQPLNNRKVITN